MSIFMFTPGPGQQFQGPSGTVYTSNVHNIITGVALSDVDAMLKLGCNLPDAAQQQTMPSMATGRFYLPADGPTLESTLTVASTIYAHQVYIPTQISAKTFNLSVVTGQTGGKCHLGIYDDANGVPGQLVFDAGEITGLTSTAVTVATPATPPTLLPGWYWFASTFAATSTMPSVIGIKANYTRMNNTLGSDTAAHALATSAEAATGVSGTFTYAALPQSFPTATLLLNADCPTFAIGT